MMTERARIKLQERAADAYRIARAWYETSGEGQGMTAATQRNAADKSAEARAGLETREADQRDREYNAALRRVNREYNAALRRVKAERAAKIKACMQDGMSRREASAWVDGGMAGGAR